MCIFTVSTGVSQRKPDAPQPRPGAAYLHVPAEGGVGAEQDLALLVGAVVHAGQLVRQAHRVLAPGVRDQQAGADLRPETAKRQVGLQRHRPGFYSDSQSPGRMHLRVSYGKAVQAPNMGTQLFLTFCSFSTWPGQYPVSQGNKSLAMGRAWE